MFKYRLLSGWPVCNLSKVSNVQRCGRKSETFCRAFGMISTGQKQPESMHVGTAIKDCSELKALRLFDSDTIIKNNF
ncbi:UNVERIFIED_ORG: hypothetical protein ABRZ91_002397 [Heyndrickxia coagulans]